MAVEETFDYIIVGAGSAGCVLAARLSEDPHCRVLLLEAGPWDSNPLLSIPFAWPLLLRKRAYDWGYNAAPHNATHNRVIECARGKVVGGSSSINAMFYVRGHPTDYDRWAASGLTGWSYRDVLPYFKRQETWERGANEYRGDAGPLMTRYSKYQDPVFEAYLDAVRDLGFKELDDYNGPHQEGFGRKQFTIADGRRCSASRGYLRPALQRPNLIIRTGATARQVLFRGHKATGVEYGRRNEIKRADVTREVLLCGGTINSPQLLMLSGIGEPQHLKRFGIKITADVRGVGKNLQDHVAASVACERPPNSPFSRGLRIDRLICAMARAYLWGTGPATDLPAGPVGFIRTSRAGSAPDLQIMFVAGSLNAKPYLPLVGSPGADGLLFRTVLLRPASRGQVTLTNGNPVEAPEIALNLLSEPSDVELLSEGIATVRRILRHQGLAPYALTEKLPGMMVTNRDDLTAYIRKTADTVHHPVGTCRMGPDADDDAVVDAQMRVRGVDGLRVVDASAMPDLVGGNINATVIMMAEKAADLIRGRPPLTAVHS